MEQRGDRNGIFDSGEVDELSNVQKMHISSTKPTITYTLDVILSVGYRHHEARTGKLTGALENSGAVWWVHYGTPVDFDTRLAMSFCPYYGKTLAQKIGGD